MKLWPFKILECIYCNILAVLLDFWYVPPGTQLSDAVPFFVVTLGSINILLLLRIMRLSGKAEPPVTINFPWAKFLTGNAIGLAFMAVLYRPNLEYMVFVIVGVFAGGNSLFIGEWYWRKSRFLRMRQDLEDELHRPSVVP